MFSVTGCRTLSTAICEPIPKISDGRTSHYTFVAAFNRAKPKQKTIDSTKKMVNVYHDYSQIVNAMTTSKEIKFQEAKLNASELKEKLKIFDHIRQHKPSANPGGVHMPSDSFFAK